MSLGCDVKLKLLRRLISRCSVSLKHKSKDRALARQTLLQKKHELQVTLDSLLVKLDKLYEIDRMLSEGCRKRIEEYQSNMEELKNIHLQIEQLREEIKNISQLIERSPIQQLESLIMNAKGIEAQVDQISLPCIDSEKASVSNRYDTERKTM